MFRKGPSFWFFGGSVLLDAEGGTGEFAEWCLEVFEFGVCELGVGHRAGYAKGDESFDSASRFVFFNASLAA